MKTLTGGASVPDRNSAAILGALNAVANAQNVDPAAIAAIIHTESVWSTTATTGSYIGLTQVGPEFVQSLGLAQADFLALSADQQIQDYGKWLDYYRFTPQVAKFRMNIAAQPLPRQAAVLQAMQFSPNGTKWKSEFANGNYSVPSTTSKQAQFLGDTSIHDMEAYYSAFFSQRPPSYGAAVVAAPPLIPPAGIVAVPPVAGPAAPAGGAAAANGNAAGAAGANISDGVLVPALLEVASDPFQLTAAQQTAAKRLLDFDGEKYPTDGCAITLSVLLQQAGILVADTFTAFALAGVLKNGRGWQQVALGEQQAGDVGSTCGAQPQHGVDHIYLVLQPVNNDEMIIADNQAQAPHFRWMSGQGKSPTTFFLRAPQ